MSEYELVDIIASYASGGGTFFTIWLTILSAYALTAYSTGRNLTSFQVAWLNTLYLFAAALAIFGFYGQFSSQIFYINELRSLRPESPQILNAVVLLAITLVAVMGTLITLIFMWQIRHSNND